MLFHGIHEIHLFTELLIWLCAQKILLSYGNSDLLFKICTIYLNVCIKNREKFRMVIMFNRKKKYTALTFIFIIDSYKSIHVVYCGQRMLSIQLE